MKEQLFHVGIKALIMNSKKEILILKANPALLKGGGKAHWDIPGGRIKKGDSAETTLKKEVEEETGIKNIEIKKIFDASISNLRIPLNNGEEVGLVLFTHLCKINSKTNIKLSEEHTEYKWASIEETKKLLSVKFAKSFIDKLDELKK